LLQRKKMRQRTDPGFRAYKLKIHRRSLSSKFTLLANKFGSGILRGRRLGFLVLNGRIQIDNLLRLGSASVAARRLAFADSWTAMRSRSASSFSATFKSITARSC